MSEETSEKNPNETPPAADATQNAPEAQTPEADAADAASDGESGSVKRLEQKNREVIAEKRALQDRLRALEVERDQREAEAQQAAEEAATKAGDVVKLREQLEAKHQKAISSKDDQIAELRAFKERTLIDNGLAAALAEAEIAERYRPAVAALLKASRRVEIDGDAAVMDGQPLADAVGLWAESEEAAHFKEAPKTEGGGARGGGTHGSKTLSRADFDRLSPQLQGQRVREGYTIT